MKALITQWLTRKWQRADQAGLREAYRVTFSTIYGRQVLQHLLDTVYCQTYDGTDPQAALVHAARRSVVQDILMNIDLAEDPEKYHLRLMEEPIR